MTSARHKRDMLAALLILFAAAAQVLPQAAAPRQNRTGSRKVPCKTIKNAASCYWIHGRLSVYSGNPPWRIWKIGTHRILAVFSGPSAFPPRSTQETIDPEFPANLERMYKAEEPRKTRLKQLYPDPAFADFDICPLEAEKKGEMQAVCIESAKHIFLQKSN